MMYEMRLWNTGCLMQGERVTGRAETFSNCSTVYRVVYHMGNLYIANSCGNLQIIVGNCTSSALVSEPVGCFLSHNHWLQGSSALTIFLSERTFNHRLRCFSLQFTECSVPHMPCLYHPRYLSLIACGTVSLSVSARAARMAFVASGIHRTLKLAFKS